MRGRASHSIFYLSLLLLPALAWAGVEHPSIGVCTRKAEFAKRQAALAPLVAELVAEESESKARRLVRMVQGAGGDWGFLVLIEHRLEDGNYLSTVYGHMAFDVLVKPGDVVRKGQRIGSQGLSTSVENGGYGSHLHFGLGHGPFRRPAGVAIGERVNLDLGEGKKVPAPIVGLGSSPDKTSRYGFPLTTMTIRRPDGTGQVATIPEQPITKEIAWFQAYVKNCRGWLNPQELLPKLVEGDE